MAVVVNNNSSDPAANSFISLAELDSYLDEHIYGAAALSRSDDDRSRAAITASMELSRLWYIGTPTLDEQRLAFCRIGLSRASGPVDSTLYPLEIKLAASELARIRLSQEDDPITSLITAVASQGLSRVEVSGIELAFHKMSNLIPNDNNPYFSLPLSVQNLIPTQWLDLSMYNEDECFVIRSL